MSPTKENTDEERTHSSGVFVSFLMRLLPSSPSSTASTRIFLNASDLHRLHAQCGEFVRVSIVAENSSRTSLLAMAHPKREQGWRQDGGALDTPVKQSGLARRRIDDDDDDDDDADEEAVLDGGVFVFLQNHSKEDESSKEEHFFTDAKETLNALRQRQKKRSEKREDDRCTIEVQANAHE
jgi:hypothetical protein